MKVSKCSGFNEQFPEHFNWGLIDSRKLAELAEVLALAIVADLRTPDRIKVPGLRLALWELAKLADIADISLEPAEKPAYPKGRWT